MMKKRSNSKKNIQKKKKSVLTIFSDERLKIIIGLFILSFSALLTIAFISHFFTWKADQSFEWNLAFSDASVTVENWSGKIGAFLSNYLLNKWFGIASFSIPFILFIIGFRLLNIRILPLRKTLRIAFFATILLSIGLGFLFGKEDTFLGTGPGGMHGFIISEWLIALIGKTGTAMLLILGYLSFFIFTFNNLLDWLKEMFQFNKGKDPTLSESFGIDIENEPDSGEYSSDPIFETEYYSPEKNDAVAGGNNSSEGEKQKDDIDLIIEQKKASEETVSNDSGEKSILDIPMEEFDPKKELSTFKMPPLELLEDHKSGDFSVSNEELINNKNKIVETLGNYKIQIDKIKATIGPTVTLYEIVPAPGIRISKIKNLEDDIALSLAALGIRIIAPIPGKGTIGIEVPNLHPEIVTMKSILGSKSFRESKHEICIALGKTISNESYTFDLTKMPHLLIAGATGQGKSVGLNVILTSILYKKHPAEVKFVLIDPKKVELTLYSRIERHYLATLPDSEEAIITDTQKVIHTLNSLTIEMDNRYSMLKMANVRNIQEYNAKFLARKLNPEKGHKYLPYIILIIDEFADLIMTAGKEVENPLARLAQLARAIGIHLIIATQRPTTNIITGVIKANFPARIAFRVISMIDSRTILDVPGANQLVGRGDMLLSSGGSELIRLQCGFIDIPELERITEFIGSQKGYPSAMLLPEYVDEDAASPLDVDLNKKDELFEDAAKLVVIHQQGSTSLIQRKFSIGYNRAGRIMDQLEVAGIVGPFEGSKARSVIFPDLQSLEQFLDQLR